MRGAIRSHQDSLLNTKKNIQRFHCAYFVLILTVKGAIVNRTYGIPKTLDI